MKCRDIDFMEESKYLFLSLDYDKEIPLPQNADCRAQYTLALTTVCPVKNINSIY